MKKQIKFLKENYLLTIGFLIMFLSSLTAVIDMALGSRGLFRYLIIICPFVIAFFLLILVARHKDRKYGIKLWFMILANIIMVEGGFALVMKRVAYYEGGKFILNIPSVLCQVAFVTGGLMVISWMVNLYGKEGKRLKYFATEKILLDIL